MHAVAERRRVGQRRRDHVARCDLDAAYGDRLLRVEPELVQRLQHVDELLAEPVLEGDALAVDPARHEHDLLVLDVDALDRADSLREVEHLRLANGSVVNKPRSRSQTSGGLRHSSIVVQIENVGANS